MSKRFKSETDDTNLKTKPFYKRTWFLVLSAITVIGLCVASGLALGGSSTSSTSEADTMSHKVAKAHSSESSATKDESSSEAESSSHQDDQSSSSEAPVSDHQNESHSAESSAANHSATQNSSTATSRTTVKPKPVKPASDHSAAPSSPSKPAAPAPSTPTKPAPSNHHAPAPAAPKQPAPTNPSQPKVSAQSLAALESAKSYARMDMSEKGIYEQLISESGEQFAPVDAQYAMAHLTGVNWNENALRSAESYQKDLSMSTAAIKEQLVSPDGEGFTNEQAQYAIDHLSK